MATLVEEGEGRGYAQLVLNPFVQDWPPPLAAFIPPSLYKSYPVPGLSQLPALRRWVGAELDVFRPQLVHALLPRAAVVVASLPRRPRRALLLTNAYGEGIRQVRPAWISERLDRWAGKRFHRVVAVSTDVERYLVSRHGYPSSKVVRISPGWRGQPLAANREHLPPTIVCVAKLRPEKGHDVVLNAFRLVRDEVPDARLVLVGEGEARARLEAQSRRLDLGESVHFAGVVDEVWPYLAEAHVFTLGSRSEAFGVAIAEAMAAGLPVVAPAVGGVLDLVSPGVSGQLFPKEDHAAMARHLVRLLTSPEERARMGAAAKQAANSYRIERTVASYFSLYDEILRRTRDAHHRADDV
ncbi:MAG: glycosyltransferase family 4 protein [Actinomycetota bacterium]|nr:glycosyltransferase family 4 protein [Actinomycetota bacterium]